MTIAKQFLTQLTGPELVRWDELLESGASEVEAQSILRPWLDPFVAILAPNDWDRADPWGDPWGALQHAMVRTPEIPMPRILSRDGRLEADDNIRISRGIGLDAAICGALVVMSAQEGLTDLHELAVWMAYRRGCRRFLVLAARADQLNDDELSAYVASEAAGVVRGWLPDAEVSHDWGSGGKAHRDAPAPPPLAKRVWGVLKNWSATPDHWSEAQTSATPREPLRDLLEGLEALMKPVCGLMGDPRHTKQESTEHCSFHDEPLSEYFELDFSAPGHGLPFSEPWVLRSCSKLWDRVSSGTDYLDSGSCWRIDRMPVEMKQEAKSKARPYSPGFMVPSPSLLSQKNISDIESRFAAWRTTPGPRESELFWAATLMLGVFHAPGLCGQLGGPMTAPTWERAILCERCSQEMPLIFNGGQWGDYEMYVWQCPQCPDQACLNFQK